MNRRRREWLFGSVLILLSCLIWWSFYYSPKIEEIEQLKQNRAVAERRYERLELRKENLEKKFSRYSVKEEQIREWENLLVKGNTIEEVNSEVQVRIQQFLEQENIELDQYNVMNASEWNDYKLGMFQISIRANHKTLALLLKFLENYEKMVKIERLTVNYHQKSRVHTIRSNIRLATLFVDNEKNGI